VDSEAGVQPDVLWDCDTFPYPFPDNYADLILSHHLIEHLENPIEHIKECKRILKVGGKLIVHYPHYSNPEAFFGFHKRYFGMYAFHPKYFNYGRDMHTGKWKGFSLTLNCSAKDDEGYRWGKPIAKITRLRYYLIDKWINFMGKHYEWTPLIGCALFPCYEVQMEIIK